MENQHLPVNYKKIMGIFGTGRSGSSWLGSIISSHPQVVYRFEPFHRLKEYPPIHQARQRLESEQLSETDLPAVYDVLLPAHPKLDRPPFFPKDFCFNMGKSWFRPVALQFGMFRPLFQWLYTCRNGQPFLVFKEVTMETMMKNVLAHTSMKVVYLVRHPCAVVDSTVRGQQQGVMPIGRHTVLKELLTRHDATWAATVVPQLDQMGTLEKETLLWRIDVEKGISAARGHENALVVIYEDLCDRPEELSKQIFEHFGLDFSKQTAAFVASFTKSDAKSSRWREVGVRSYFSVVRNPALMKNKWQQQMAKEAQQRVLKLVEDSPAFQYCANFGKWG